MSDWLTHIAKEIDAVTTQENAEPNEPTGKGEHVVGIVPERLRKMHYLACKYRSEAAVAKSAVLIVSPEARQEKMDEAERLNAQSEALKDLFWVSCRHSFPVLWSKGAIGIRKGWEMVWMERDETAGLGLIGALLGSGILLQPDDTEDAADRPKGKSSLN